MMPALNGHHAHVAMPEFQKTAFSASTAFAGRKMKRERWRGLRWWR
jgi:hypothetical protein